MPRCIIDHIGRFEDRSIYIAASAVDVQSLSKTRSRFIERVGTFAKINEIIHFNLSIVYLAKVNITASNRYSACCRFTCFSRDENSLLGSFSHRESGR